MLQNALQFSHTLLKEILTDYDHVVDATMGNGNDTLFLAQTVQPNGKVYAFDVQKQALLKTQQRLVDNKLMEHTELIQDGHEHIENYLTEDEAIKQLYSILVICQKVTKRSLPCLLLLEKL